MAESIKKKRDRREYDKKRYWENREKQLARVKEYYRKNKEAKNKYDKDRYWKDPEKMKEKTKKYHRTEAGKVRLHSNNLKRVGLTPELYNEMNDKQNGLCAICGMPPEQGKRVKRLAVDHDHKTNAVRGLLCITCNRAIGYFKDNPDIIYNAAVYVRDKSKITDKTIFIKKN